MSKHEGSAVRAAASLVGLACLCLLSACATDGAAPTASLAPGANAAAVAGDEEGGDLAPVAYEDNATYAGSATYRCDDGQQLAVNNSVTAVSIGFADGSTMQLPASPADSHTRYVQDQYAFVFDGDEALFFRPKTAPATCKR